MKSALAWFGASIITAGALLTLLIVQHPNTPIAPPASLYLGFALLMAIPFAAARLLLGARRALWPRPLTDIVLAAPGPPLAVALWIAVNGYTPLGPLFYVMLGAAGAAQGWLYWLMSRARLS